MRFTDDENAKGLVIRPFEIMDCDCSEGILQSLPEWEYLLDESGNHYNCNIPNILEVGSFKVDQGSKSFKNAYYLITVAGSFLYYMGDQSGFYSVATNRVKVASFFVKTKEGPRIALCTRKGFLLADLNGGYTMVIPTGTLSAGAWYKHRIFVGMTGGSVQYSAPEDYTNFTDSVDEGGSLSFPQCGGEIIAMKVYDDALYIFFKSGIMRLRAGGEPSGFYSERLDYTGGDIFSRTICVCQHAIYFLSRSGVYRLKGKKTERLDIKAELPTEESGLEGYSIWKDRPMIRYQKANGNFETMVISQNGKSAFFMKGMETLGLGEDGRVLFTDKLKYICQLTEHGTHWIEGRFFGQETDLGFAGKKRLERVKFFGSGSFTVTIFWEKMSITKTFTFENGSAIWKIGHVEYGETFQFCFELGRASKITDVQVEYKTFA
jgi:hypothetical protein